MSVRSPRVTIPGRGLAYADFALGARSDGAHHAEVSDLDRLIAWGFALASDADAREPVVDEIVRANGYPLYPVLGYHPVPGSDEAAFPHGMAMTLEYASTGPTAGSCWLQGRFYLRKNST